MAEGIRAIAISGATTSTPVEDSVKVPHVRYQVNDKDYPGDKVVKQEPGTLAPDVTEVVHVDPSGGIETDMSGEWMSVYIDPAWLGQHFLPSDLSQYRRVRIGADLLVKVFTEAKGWFSGVMGKAPYSLPITKQIGSSLNVGSKCKWPLSGQTGLWTEEVPLLLLQTGSPSRVQSGLG